MTTDSAMQMQKFSTDLVLMGMGVLVRHADGSIERVHPERVQLIDKEEDEDEGEDT